MHSCCRKVVNAEHVFVKINTKICFHDLSSEHILSQTKRFANKYLLWLVFTPRDKNFILSVKTNNSNRFAFYSANAGNLRSLLNFVIFLSKMVDQIRRRDNSETETKGDLS